jgi:hypothetical protein
MLRLSIGSSSFWTRPGSLPFLAGLFCWLLLGSSSQGPLLLPRADAQSIAATTFTVLHPNVTGLVPGAVGEVTGRVTGLSSPVVEVRFRQAARPHVYAAGTVSALTNGWGWLTRLVRGRDVCVLKYKRGAVKSVNCTRLPRRLGSSGEILLANLEDEPGFDDEDFATQDVEPSLPQDRQLQSAATCKDCLVASKYAFAKGYFAGCRSRLSGLIPASHEWAKGAASSLCGIAANLGRSDDTRHRVCRCSCASNAGCRTNVCSGGICLVDAVDNGAPCPDGEDADCFNGKCARASYPSGPYVCCANGQHVSSAATGDRYCLGVYQAGDPCTANNQCSTGVCSGGACLPSKIAEGLPCPDGEGSDCASTACALGSYPDGTNVCCDGEFSYVSQVTGKAYCYGVQAAGEACDENLACESGFCLANVCQAQKLPDGAECPRQFPDDCQNFACYLDAYPTGKYVCCPSGNYVRSSLYGTFHCTESVEVDGPCESNGMCKSGVCAFKPGGSTNVCLAEKIASGQPCTDREDADCASGTCNSSGFCQ